MVDRILKPYLRKIPSYLKDTKDFLNRLGQHTHLHEDESMASVDVSALYTSIPHAGGLEAIRLVLSEDPPAGIDPETVVALLEIVLKNNTFKFNGKFYHQPRPR